MLHARLRRHPLVLRAINAVETAMLQIATTAPHGIATKALSTMFWIPGMSLVTLLILRTKKRAITGKGLLLVAILALITVGITACGNGAAPTGGTPTGVDNVQVSVSAIGAPGSGSANSNQTASIQITIQ